MIYTNKTYAIDDIAKKLKIKRKDIDILINAKIIDTVDMYGVKFLEGWVALNLLGEIKKYNEELKGKKVKDGGIQIPKGDILNE